MAQKLSAVQEMELLRFGKKNSYLLFTTALYRWYNKDKTLVSLYILPRAGLIINLICFVLANLHFKFSLTKCLSSFYATNPYFIAGSRTSRKNREPKTCNVEVFTYLITNRLMM